MRWCKQDMQCGSHAEKAKSKTYICGDDGAVDIGVSDNGIPTPSLDALRVSVGMTLEERPAEFLGGGISDDASVPVLLLLLLGL